MGWIVKKRIGEGSSGEVFEIARELSPNEWEYAALKRITIPKKEDLYELEQDGFNGDGITATINKQKDDIKKEYSLIQSLRGHTNIVNVFDIYEVQHKDGLGWDVYIRMELATALPKILEQNGGNLSEAEVVKLGQDICRALMLCENKHILHRDIKPQNILVSNNGDYKLGDFGIAKIAERTSSGTKAGTFRYMAPEVYNNLPYGNRADLYSLGMVMYWLLNERRAPFMPLYPKIATADDDSVARSRRFSGEKLPPPVNGSVDLKRIVLKACEYNPSDRYYTAGEMFQELNRLMADNAQVQRQAEDSSFETLLRQDSDSTFRATGFSSIEYDSDLTQRSRKTKGEQQREEEERKEKNKSREQLTDSSDYEHAILTKKIRILWFSIVFLLMVILVITGLHFWQEKERKNTGLTIEIPSSPILYIETPTPTPVITTVGNSTPAPSEPKATPSMGPFTSGRFTFVNGAGLLIPTGFSDTNTTGDYTTGINVKGYHYNFYNSDYDMQISLTEATLDSYLDTGIYGNNGSTFLKAKYDELIAQKGGAPVWRPLEDYYFKITGYSGDYIYYTYMLIKNDVVYTIDYFYPTANRQICDRIVESTEASFF